MAFCLLLSSLLASIVQSEPRTDTFLLRRLDPQKYPRARCLDGSFGAYYISAGTGPWVFHFQGGGWCTLDFKAFPFSQTCVERARGINPFGEPQSLGGSTNWPPQGCDPPYTNASVCTSDGGNHGVLSADPKVNPTFFQATKVYVPYCSGDSFAGSRDDPVETEGMKLYFRGLDIRQAVIADLLETQGLNKARTIVIGGASAGGMAVFMGVDAIANQVHKKNRGARVVAYPSAGFIMDVLTFNATDPKGGERRIRGMFKWLYENMNMSAGIPQSCLDTFAEGQKHQCLFPANLVATGITSAVFMVNSLIDAAQSSTGMMDLRCDPGIPGNCNPAQLAYLDRFRADMIDAAAPLFDLPHGVWLLECFVHILDTDGAYSRIVVNNITQGELLSGWIKGLIYPTVVIDPSKADNLNPTCSKY